MKLHEYQSEFHDLITIVASRKHIPESAVERDYYIVLLLKNLENSEYADKCVFKGGTSLSKCYPGSIERFSEDIDLTFLGMELSDKACDKNIKRIENIMTAVDRNRAHQKDLDREPLDPDEDKWRVGACIRLGDNRYYAPPESNKAVLGDAYNITVRNVITRARVGIRASCALDNVLIDNVQVFGDGGTAVHFGEGVVKNVRVSNIGYAFKHAPRDIDDNRKEKGLSNMDYRLEPCADRKLCAVYFDETQAENIVVTNMFAGKNLTSVFGGTGNVSLIANNIIREDAKVPLFDDTLTVTKAQADSF